MAEFFCCEENISAYLDGELSPEEVRNMEAHLQNCSQCRENLKCMQAVSQSVQIMYRPTVSQLLASQIISRLSAKQALSDLTLTRILRSWGLVSLFSVGALLLIFGPVLLGILGVVLRHLGIIMSLVFKLSWQIPLSENNLILAFIFMVGGLIAFYGFSKVYRTMPGKGLLS